VKTPPEQVGEMALVREAEIPLQSDTQIAFAIDVANAICVTVWKTQADGRARDRTHGGVAKGEAAA
jgi:hypothetical protein